MTRTNIADLALLGGSPWFSEPLHVGRPNVGDREAFLERVNGILERNWLTNQGPLVREFERRVAEKLKIKHCIAMCNGTVALEIAIRALGLTGEVILPSFTFIATAHALQWQGITPVFCDIDPVTFNIDPGRVESLVTPRTTGLLGVHLYGRPCDVCALSDIATRRHLRLFFDASHAFGASHGGKTIGSFGECEVFSFHATKCFNTLEGGAVVTNDDDLAEKVRLMKNFGFSGLDNVIHIGTNGKMNEVSAAMGLTNLEHLDRFIAANRRNYRCYREGLEGIPGLSLISRDGEENSNYHYVVAKVEATEFGLNRDLLVALLRAENVMARRYFHPGCHRMEPYRSLYPHAGLQLAATEALCDRILVLPTGPSVSPEDIVAICALIRYAAEHPQRVSAHCSDGPSPI